MNMRTIFTFRKCTFRISTSRIMLNLYLTLPNFEIIILMKIKFKTLNVLNL